MTVARDLANVAPLMASSGANVAFDDSVILNGGVSNGVVYLNGSKEARTSSDFNFNGSLLNANVNLHLGGSSANTITVNSGSLTLNNNLNVNSGKYYFDQANTRLGINTTTPKVSFDINATDGLSLPAGTNAQRPAGVADGTIRFNTQDNLTEVFSGGQWAPVSKPTPLYSYDSRGTLRTLTNSKNGDQAFVEDIGYFSFNAGVIDIDDDETAFVVSGVGTWILSAPTWNFVDVYTEFIRGNRSFSALVPNTLVGNYSSTVCQFADIPAAENGDMFLVVPNEGYICCSETYVSARYDNCFNCVVISVNPLVCSTGGTCCVLRQTNTSSVTSWKVCVFKS